MSTPSTSAWSGLGEVDGRHAVDGARRTPALMATLQGMLPAYVGLVRRDVEKQPER